MPSPLVEAAARAIAFSDEGHDGNWQVWMPEAEAVLDVFVREATTQIEALRWPNGYATTGRVVADVLAALAEMRGDA